MVCLNNQMSMKVSGFFLSFFYFQTSHKEFLKNEKHYKCCNQLDFLENTINVIISI